MAKWAAKWYVKEKREAEREAERASGFQHRLNFHPSGWSITSDDLLPFELTMTYPASAFALLEIESVENTAYITCNCGAIERISEPAQARLPGVQDDE
jgi:hypothetical protein